MNEQAIFLAALEIPDLAARAAYVAQACAENAELERQVNALLAAHERSGEFLDVPVYEQMAAQPLDVTVNLRQGEAPVAKSNNPMNTEAESNDDDYDDVTLNYLDPSSKPGSLGRLAHYEVLEVLGKGGFGTVVRAFDEKLQRVVAIKMMSPQMAATSPPRKRFLREARSSAAIRHENVVAIHDIQEQPMPYLVMEYIPGETLQRKLDRVGPFDVLETLRIGEQIAAGLAAAHDKNLIHRDIKPANILLESGIVQKVKITDFGLARAADDASLTQSGVIAGTPMYMAPEQAAGIEIDYRADLFSFGSVMYVMCSGRPPFRAANTLAVLKRVTEDTPRPIREIIPEVPQWLCDVITKLHAKKPEDRFGSAQEVADLLGRYLAELKVHGKVEHQPGAQATGLPREAPSLALRAGALEAPTRKVGWVAKAAAAVLLILCIGVGLTEALRLTNFFGADVPRPFTPKGPLIVTATDLPTPPGKKNSDQEVAAGGGQKEEIGASHSTSLFNAKDLTGWKVVGHNGWSVKDGILVGDTVQGNFGFLMTEREFTDYDLELEFKLTPNSDTGVFVRAWSNGAPIGNDFVELQFIDNELLGELKGDRRHGALLNFAEPKPTVDATLSAWQQARVRVEGKRVQAWLGGKQVFDTVVPTLREQGSIALQLCLGRVGFRNLRVAAIDPELAWQKKVAGLRAEEQVRAVVDELLRRNPEWDGAISKMIENDVVVRFELVTDNVSDLRPVRAFSGLRELACQGTSRGKGSFADLSHLAGMKLAHLGCRSNRITDLTPLKDMKLTYLDCGFNPIKDLTPIRSLPLDMLIFHGTEVADLNQVKSMSVTKLAFDDTRIADLSPLVDLRLTYLSIEGTPVANLTPLAKMPLEFLNCHGSRVTDLSPLQNVPLKEILFEVNLERDGKILRSIPTLETINLMPRAETLK